MRYTAFFLICLGLFSGCKKTETDPAGDPPVFYSASKFVMGADLSYVNQILDMEAPTRTQEKSKVHM